ncbi:F-box only protein 31-like [Myotis myotis]|uniref:F-box only protein 31-like n=1 Tax=Myotis myotis TaxID=51298 RepID=UPI0017494E0F|nr:F-box only protein 31-like [Myotis myotis]
MAKGKWCPQKSQGQAEKAAAEGKQAPAEKHLEADAAAGCWVGSGRIASPRPPPHCSLQDLRVEMLVVILASLPVTDLASLAQVCTKFRRILHMDNIWRRRCREEFGICETLQNLEAVGTSYREVYAKLFHPDRHILGLWGRDIELYKTLLYIVVDVLGITGWTYRPCLNTHVDGPMQFKPAFRIRLRERKSATVECMEGRHRRPHSRRLQIRKDRLTSQCQKRDPRRDSPTRLREEFGPKGADMECHSAASLPDLPQPLPPAQPPRGPQQARPLLRQMRSDRLGLMIFMLSFHGKCARLTHITGMASHILEIHLTRRIQLRDGEIFRDFHELSRLVREMEEQVLREQQPQQQEDGTEESEGHGWQSPAQPSVGESGAAAAEEQPAPFVLPVGVSPRDQNYPRTCRMCFYGVETVPVCPSNWRYPGVVILFDENHLGFIDLEEKSFILFGRVQNTFQNTATPPPRGQGVRAGDGQLGVVHKVLPLLVVAPVLAQLGAGRGATQSLRRRQVTVERPKQKFKTVELLEPLFAKF